jgi:replication-associated recombination protein RarA
MHWYIRFGWLENPFIIKPNTALIGMEKEKKTIINYVESETISVLTGDVGLGKTSMLLWLKENAVKNAVYINATNVKTEEDFKTIMRKHLSFWDKIRGKICPRNAVLLIDEAQYLTPAFTESVRMMYDEGVIRSVVIAASSIEQINFTEPFLHRVGNRIITLQKLSENDAVGIVNSRTEGNNPFEEEAMRMIGGFSNYNPRKVLENCERVAMNTNKDENIGSEDVEKILREKM